MPTTSSMESNTLDSSRLDDTSRGERRPNVNSPAFLCFYQNTRGLRSRTNDVLTATSYSHEYSAYVFVETWLNDGILDGELFDTDQYNVFRSDRNFAATCSTRGGGVLLAVNQDFSAVQVNIKPFHDGFLDLVWIDILMVRVQLNNSRWLYILVVYVPPKRHIQVYEKLCELLESFQGLMGPDILVLGDFNIPEFHSCQVDKSASPAYTAIGNLMKFYGLSQQNSVVNRNTRLLDLVLCSQTCIVLEASNSFVPVDEHHPCLTVELRDFTPLRIIPYNGVKEYNLRKANYLQLYSDMQNIDWDSLYNIYDPNRALDLMYGKIYAVLDKNVPKKKKVTNIYPPWFTSQIIYSIKMKHKAFVKYKATGDSTYYENFKQLRTGIKKDVKIAHMDYLARTEENLKTNPRDFWKFFNNKRNTTRIPSTLSYCNKSINNPQLITDSFADYFSGSFTDAIGTPHNNESQFLNVNLLNLTKITTEETIMALKKLKSKMTTGPDQLPAFLLRDCHPVLAQPLTYIFNVIVATQKFPQAWKVSRVCPVLKSGDRTELTNYRPIAIVCNFGKVFETILHSRIYNHVSKMIGPMQHGFMKGRSTVTNLVCMTQFLCQILDRKGQVDVIYTDLSKAFDKLDHNIFLTKLDGFGFSARLIELIRDYLSNRTQYVQCFGYRSGVYRQKSGVPQGSVLGPLFFNLFVNDLATKLSVDCLMYADDVKLYREIGCREDCDALQRGINIFSEWCYINNLMLNVSKCNAMTYCKRRTYVEFNYKIDGFQLEKPTDIKDLGVYFDRELTFDKHLHSVTSSAFSNLGFVIRNCKNFKQAETLKSLYVAFVRSRLEYASIVWYPLQSYKLQDLEKIQRRFLKLATFVTEGYYPQRGYPQEELLKMFNMSSLIKRKKVNSISFLHKLINNNLDCTPLLDQLTFRVPRVSARGGHLFQLAIPHSNVLLGSPLHSMCRDYAEWDKTLDLFICTLSDICAIYDVNN